MTFSQRAKEELASIYGESADAIDVQISAMLFFGRTSFVSGQILQTEHRCVAEVLIDLITESISPIMTLIKAPNPRRKDTAQYFLKIDSDFELAEVKANFMPSDFFERLQWQNNDISSALIRGAFLVCGSISDPQKEYHLEFVLGDEAFALAVQKLIARFELDAHMTTRRQMTLVYLKGQGEITDMLSILGAQSARFAMEDAFIRKELRNNANRATNCDSANVQRSVAAASRQMQAIERLIAAKGENSLPPALLETAKLRLQYPEVSLEELGRLCDPPVGKSGVNHRLRKLEQMAGELEEAVGGQEKAAE